MVAATIGRQWVLEAEEFNSQVVPTHENPVAEARFEHTRVLAVHVHRLAVSVARYSVGADLRSRWVRECAASGGRASEERSASSYAAAILHR